MTGLLSAWREWQERREILRDIRRRRADNSERDRFLLRDELTEALAAIELNDRPKGTAIWLAARERFPNEIRLSPLALQVLLKLNRYDEAEELMRIGQKKHPRDVYFAKGLASVAQTRGNHKVAVELYAAMRERFPGVMQGYVLGALSLAALNRVDEAEALAKQAMEIFPDEIGGFLEYARVAGRVENWTEALRRWKIVQEAFPTRPFGLYGEAQSLIKLERYDDADEVLEAARFRFPTESGLLAELARCAQARGNFPEAVKRWKRRIERVPMETYGYSNAADAFVQMGEFDEAEAMLRAGVDRFPTEEGPSIALAKYLHKREEYAKEAEAWAALREAFPTNEEGYKRGADALRLIGEVDQSVALLEEHKRRFAQ